MTLLGPDNRLELTDKLDRVIDCRDSVRENYGENQHENKFEILSSFDHIITTRIMQSNKEGVGVSVNRNGQSNNR